MITINDPPLNERLRNYFDNSASSRWGHSADDRGKEGRRRKNGGQIKGGKGGGGRDTRRRGGSWEGPGKRKFRRIVRRGGGIINMRRKCEGEKEAKNGRRRVNKWIEGKEGPQKETCVGRGELGGTRTWLESEWGMRGGGGRGGGEGLTRNEEEDGRRLKESGGRCRR